MYDNTHPDPQIAARIAAEREENRRAIEAHEASLRAMQPKDSESETLLKSAVACVTHPQDPARPWTQSDVEDVFRQQSKRVCDNDLDGMKALLGAQAQALHMLFAQAMEKYAYGNRDSGKVYGHMALKAQNYFRMTVAALAGMKGGKSVASGKNEGTTY